jgi:hypothetical protein
MIIYILLIILILLLSFILKNINSGININGGDKININGGDKININGGNKINKKTYKIFYNKEYTRETYSYLINRLNSLGWEEQPYNKKYVNFAFSLLNNNHIAADLKHALNGHKKFAEKDFLYKYVKSHIPHTENLKTYKWHGDVVIIKEALSEQQKGVYVAATEKDFLKIKSRLANTRAVVSAYIKNPLLFEGKKFHLRIMIFIFIYRQKHNNKLIKKISYIKKNIVVRTSKKKFIINKKEDYLDPEITISSGKYTDRLIYFSEVEKQYSQEFINKCKKSIDDAVGSISLDNISLYPEQKAGLFIFGADMILDDTGYAWILELNDRPGPTPGVIERKGIEAIKQFEKPYFKYFFQFMLDKIVLPYFTYLYS